MLAAAAAAVLVTVWHQHPVSLTDRTQSKDHSSPARSASVVNPSQSPAFAPLPATTAVPEPQLSAALKLVMDARTDFQQRERAIRLLGGRLDDTDREALYTFLRQHNSEDDGQLGQVLKNELLDALCRMQPPPSGLRELLTQMYQDQSQNIVVRDYAVQHLAAFYRQMAAATDVDSQTQYGDLRQTQQILWQALNDTDGSIAGTALLGLSQLVQQGWPGFDAGKIGEAALKLAGDGSAGELTRITAFQVCANLGVKDALSLAWGMAQQAETKSEQISAIAALGALGGPAQEPFLNGLIQGSDERLKLPAQQALGQIEKRLRQTARGKSG